jgi:glycosyltransferase involved in cell wall biosynthesis
VVTISASGRQDVHECFGLPLDKIEVVHPGVESIFCPVSADEVEAFRKREQLPNQFILHVGTLQPRKNIPLLISAFARLEQPELELVLVGGKGWSYQEIYDKVTELGLEKRVRFAGYVPDDELPLWYNAASVLVLPSVYEGFGMPVAQAMACGTPVIAAETSSLPEAAGGAARLFDPQDEMALAEQMVTVLDDSQIAAKMRQQGLTQAQHFSWQQAGQKMAAIYQRTLAEL